jgi:hypothetical protein
MPRLLHAVLAAAAALAVPGAHGQGDARRSVEQKVSFSRALVTSSPVAARIKAGASHEARELLREGTELQRSAEQALKAGDLAAADRDANKAILLVGRARQLVPDDLQQSAGHRARFEQLLASTEALADSYDRHRKAAAQPTTAEWTDTQRQLDRIRSLQSSGQLGEATRLLGDVQQRLLRQMSALLGNQTIDYTVRFESPRQEYDYELARYRSLEGLVPAAIKEFNPSAEARAEVTGHVERSRQLIGAAERQLAERPEAAVATLREAVKEVHRALGAAGLVTPQ